MKRFGHTSLHTSNDGGHPSKYRYASNAISTKRFRTKRYTNMYIIESAADRTSPKPIMKTCVRICGDAGGYADRKVHAVAAEY